MADSRAVQQAILQTLYALFLGGLLTAVVVVGVVTFYPPPEIDDARMQELNRREEQILLCPAGDCTRTPEEEAELREISDERQALYDEQDKRQRAWNRTSSIIFIGMATALLALSLIRSERAIVLRNGLLLGGLFTMVGGVGTAVASDEGPLRFLVLVVAAAITVTLGYLRFARQGQSPAPAAPAAGVGSADADLEARLAEVERRLRNLRAALGD